jgi:preprotein translocase subunit YajC
MLSIPSSSAALAAHPSALLADGSAGSSLSGLLPIILMFAVIYFIVLRPMSKQEKDRKKRVEGLKKGDQVVLQGGILGRISNADDPKIAVVELADRVKVRVLKSKIEDLQDSVLKDDKDAPKKDDKAEKADKKDDKASEKAEKASDKPEKADKASDKAKEPSDQDNDKDARKGA